MGATLRDLVQGYYKSVALKDRHWFNSVLERAHPDFRVILPGGQSKTAPELVQSHRAWFDDLNTGFSYDDLGINVVDTGFLYRETVKATVTNSDSRVVEIVLTIQAVLTQEGEMVLDHAQNTLVNKEDTVIE